MQRMTEFVKHGVHLVKREQRRLARRRLRNVQVIGHHRLGAEQARTAARRRSSTRRRALRAARNSRQEKRQRLTVGIEDFEDAHVRLIDRQIVAFLEGEAVELVAAAKKTPSISTRFSSK